MTERLYHLIPATQAPSELRPEGPFVHLSSESQLEATRARHFRGVVVDALEVDRQALDPALLRVEDTTGHGAFPHYYGVIPGRAIVARCPLAPLGRADVERALPAVRRVFAPTPLVPADGLSARLGRTVLLKLETATPTRVFKLRGALSAIAELPATATRVVTASGGNHGISVAFAARASGRAARVYVPSAASAEKVARIEQHGAVVVRHGVDYQEAEDAGRAYAVAEGLRFVHAYDDPDVVAGQGTLALELEPQLAGLGIEAVDQVVAGVGGGGLLGGLAAALEGRVGLVGVEPEGAAGLARAFQAGVPVRLDRVSTVADGLAARQTGALGFRLAQLHAGPPLVVADEDLLAAMRLYFEAEGVVTEPAGAAALAGLLRFPERFGPRVVLVVCGSNATRAQLAQLSAGVHGA